ncbi:hypothetical protein TUM4438_01110 [Shewanella sairae]|uniref:Uncharacterized protein n=1 Tax=Shewanella sairae TaxID=190310 RepID=A0ABQ4NZ37_9GAMM|nr:hypothetical protein [Shewanella sairae]MCL1130990.1 hypothetical protein [Shewanella sairae]GIU40280.1 hypothetical protein TUM4438_01110 [Shewanella sairae]
MLKDLSEGQNSKVDGYDLQQRTLITILNHRHLFRSNPFEDAKNGVIAEWMQLLMVVERIKHDKSSREILEKVDRLIEEIFSNSDVNHWVKANRSIFNSYANTGDELKWEAVSLLLGCLDNGDKYNTYLVNAFERQQERTERESKQQIVRVRDAKVINIETKILPSLMEDFDFQNLNDYRLGYPHHLIMRAYRYGNDLLKKIANLNSFDNDKFLTLREDVVSSYLDSITSGQTKYPTKMDVVSASKYRHDLIHSFNRAIEEKVANKLKEDVEAIEKALNFKRIQSAGFAPIVTDITVADCTVHPQVSAENSESYDESLAQSLCEERLQLSFQKSEFIKALNDGYYRHFISAVSDAAFEHIEKSKELTWRGSNHFRMRNSENYISGLWNFQHWSLVSCTQVFNKRTTASFVVMQRGMHFSHWCFKQEKQRRQTIRQKTELFVKETEGRFGKASTVRQSYEALKKFTKECLPEIIYSQVQERLPVEQKGLSDFFSPLNSAVDHNFIGFNKSIQENFYWLGEQLPTEPIEAIVFYRKLVRLVRDLEAKGELEVAIEVVIKCLTGKVLEDKSSVIHYSYSRLSPFGNYDLPNTVEVFNLKEPLKFQIDVFPGVLI